MTKYYNEDEANAIGKLIAGNDRLNQDSSIFTAQMLDVLKRNVYQGEIAPNAVLAAIPRSTGTPEYAETITYRTTDNVGIAKMITAYADDLPRVDLSGAEVTVRIHALGASYGFNQFELTASAATGVQLPERKARAARTAIDRKLQDIAMVGDPLYNLYGITNHPNMGATATVGAWSTATFDAVLQDMVDMTNAVMLQSNGFHRPNKFLLPLTSHARIIALRNAAGQSVQDVFKMTYPDIEIIGAVQMETAGTGGTRLAIIGEFTADNVELENPLPFKQYPAQERNLELVIGCVARTAGVILHNPLAFTKNTGAL